MLSGKLLLVIIGRKKKLSCTFKLKLIIIYHLWFVVKINNMNVSFLMFKVIFIDHNLIC